MQAFTKRYISVGVAVLVAVVLGCATASKSRQPEDMELQVVQLPDEGFAIEERGAVSVAYQLTVHNRRADAVTLREIRMQVLGSGPYTLRNEPASVSQTIEAGQEARITFTMWSYPRQHKSTTREAIWVSGAAQFESAQGAFQREFTLSFREP